jgi:hypothetical protein
MEHSLYVPLTIHIGAFQEKQDRKAEASRRSAICKPGRYANITIPSFSYLNNAFDMDKSGKYYLGVYYANHAYTGNGESVGLMAGAEIPLVEGKVHLMGDVMTGNNETSVAVVGAVFYLPSDWQLSFGAQLPIPGSNNDYGMVFEITKL